MIQSSRIKTLTNLEHYGNKDLLIGGICSIFAIKEFCLTWISPDRVIDPKQMMRAQNNAIILSEFPNDKVLKKLTESNCVVVVASKPKETFSACVKELERKGIISFGKWYAQERVSGINIHPTARIACKIDKSQIQNLWIGAYAVVADNVKLSNNVKIGPGSVIGGDGFGFYDGPDKQLVRMPHVGGVYIEEGVEIGANCTIDRGTIDDTVLKSGCKVDNLVHIAHNVVIGKNAALVAKVLICGSCEVGDNAWIGASAVVRETLRIGDHAIVGIGSAVVKSIPSGETWAGVPAKKIK